MNTRRRTWPIVVATTVSFGFSVSTLGQTKTIPVYVDDPRPVEAAISALLQQYAVTITYEDPSLEYSADLRDATAENAPVAQPGQVRDVVPRGGVLHATYESSAQRSSTQNVADALQTVVDAKNAQPWGGHFAVYRDGDNFHVVPVEVRDRNGAWVAEESVLDTRITFSSAGESDGDSLLAGVIKEVSKVSGEKFFAASAPHDAALLSSYHGSVDAKDEPARDVLMRLLHSINPEFTWSLYYLPPFHAYALAAFRPRKSRPRVGAEEAPPAQAPGAKPQPDFVSPGKSPSQR